MFKLPFKKKKKIADLCLKKWRFFHDFWGVGVVGHMYIFQISVKRMYLLVPFQQLLIDTWHLCKLNTFVVGQIPMTWWSKSITVTSYEYHGISNYQSLDSLSNRLSRAG